MQDVCQVSDFDALLKEIHAADYALTKPEAGDGGWPRH